MIRDYASDSSEANAEKIRAELSRMTPKDLSTRARGAVCDDDPD